MTTLHAPLSEAPFEAWTSPHLDCMHRTARRILGCDDLAWDAVQETLLRFWNRGAAPPDHPRAALLAVVVPTSLQLLRSDHRRRHHETLAASSRRPDPHCDDPRCIHERRELTTALRRTVERLPPACREAFTLRVEQGADYRAIASRLGIPLGTVRSRLARARTLLERELAPATFSATRPNSRDAAGIHGADGSAA